MSHPKIILQKLRKEYTRSGLSESELEADPFLQFEKWLKEALLAGLEEPNAMTLATTGRDGRPTARIVLLKDVDGRGFIFYTNYESRKGRNIAENPQVSLSFFWQGLERQVRIEGIAEKVSAEESDDYFRSRPRGSQLSALASPQSQTISGREQLERKWEALSQEYSEGEIILRPAHWGGYRVIPDRVEFWQGRDNRLHDRLLYERETAEDVWKIQRLAP